MTAATNGTVVREVIASTASGDQVMSALPGLVRRLIDEEAWREFPAPGIGGVVRHEFFAEFITEAPPRGLGGRASQLVALCGKDKLLADEVRRLLLAEIPAAAPAGGDHRSAAFQDCDTNLKPTPPKPDRVGHVVARLKRDDPDLAERVVRGEITSNAAAREKGWRKPRIVLSTPERVADSLRKWMPRDALARLAELLTQESPDDQG